MEEQTREDLEYVGHQLSNFYNHDDDDTESIDEEPEISSIPDVSNMYNLKPPTIRNI
jgi:hypothetical protein